jgi:thiamine kinase-like enzyme
MRDFHEKIQRYLKVLSPEVLGLRSIDSVRILGVTPGAYNLNFHVQVNQRPFIFRVNIDQQSGLADQIDYEYAALNFLSPHRIAPRAYHIDTGKTFFDFDILVEEYLEGPHLEYKPDQIRQVAELLAELHSLPALDKAFMIWQDPIERNHKFVNQDIAQYRGMPAADQQTLRLAAHLITKTRDRLAGREKDYRPTSLNHTDVVLDNFIRTSAGLHLIDWEKPRLDDSSYDIGCFLCEPAQLWCSLNIMSKNEREDFLKTYCRIRGLETDAFRRKVEAREPLVALHWILWGAIKLSDLKNRRTIPELVNAHEEKLARYERIANPKNIEKILDTMYS